MCQCHLVALRKDRSYKDQSIHLALFKCFQDSDLFLQTQIRIHQQYVIILLIHPLRNTG